MYYTNVTIQGSKKLFTSLIRKVKRKSSFAFVCISKTMPNFHLTSTVEMEQMLENGDEIYGEMSCCQFYHHFYEKLLCPQFPKAQRRLRAWIFFALMGSAGISCSWNLTIGIKHKTLTIWHNQCNPLYCTQLWGTHYLKLLWTFSLYTLCNMKV